MNIIIINKGKKIFDGPLEKIRPDEFIVKYRNLYNRQILKFGKIGDRITFYEDMQMENNEYVIFKDDDIYEITFDQNEIIDMENYILDTLRKIDEAESEEQEMADHNEKMVKEVVGDDGGWLATDDKNYGKLYTVDQTLSKEEYRKALLKKIRGN